MRARNAFQLRRLDRERQRAAQVPDVVRDKRDAEIVMRAFDRLGPQARQAIAHSRFDADAEHVLRRYGGPFADDGAVARRVCADDDRNSGYFGPKAPAGI